MYWSLICCHLTFCARCVSYYFPSLYLFKIKIPFFPFLFLKSIIYSEEGFTFSGRDDALMWMVSGSISDISTWGWEKLLSNSGGPFYMIKKTHVCLSASHFSPKAVVLKVVFGTPLGGRNFISRWAWTPSNPLCCIPWHAWHKRLRFESKWFENFMGRVSKGHPLRHVHEMSCGTWE